MQAAQHVTNIIPAYCINIFCAKWVFLISKFPHNVRTPAWWCVFKSCNAHRKKGVFS